MRVLTSLLLNQMSLRERCLCLDLRDSVLFLSSRNIVFWVYPLAARALSYTGAALLNASLSLELSVRRPLIAEGMSFGIEGGWFDRALMYERLSLGFLIGYVFPLFKFSVRS